MHGDSRSRQGNGRVDRAVPCSMLKPGGEAALLLASPDGAANPPCRLAPTPWRSALTGSCRRGGDLLMANVFCGRGVNRVLGDVGGVIPDALEMPRNEH